MEITFKGTRDDKDIEEKAVRKFQTLEKFIRNELRDAAHAYVELGKEAQSHQTGRVWKAEADLDTDGKRFRAAATEETLENAIDRVVAELKQELRNSKTKRESLLRRGGNALKGMLRGFRAS